MRIVFGVLGLLIVLAIVGSLAKTQLKAVGASPDRAVAAGVVVPVTEGTPAQQSQQLQQRVADDVNEALKQGAARSRDAP
jgi:hypothetical protein